MEWKRKGENKVLREVEYEGVPMLQFPMLQQLDFIVHGFSTRMGGISEGPFATMNFTFTRGDDPDHVLENYRRMAAALNVDVERMVLSYQTHTTNVKVVTEADAGKGICRERDYQDVDGLITNVKGITLVTFYADCVPLYFVDPVHQAIGLSHSGWRGTVQRMGQVTLDAMHQVYGTQPEDVFCCIGPSICNDCFEVGEEVVQTFREAKIDCRAKKKENGKFYLDLWKANEAILLEAGVRAERIQITDICTKCNPKNLFSHRVMGNARGNLAAFLCLKD